MSSTTKTLIRISNFKLLGHPLADSGVTPWISLASEALFAQLRKHLVRWQLGTRPPLPSPPSPQQVQRVTSYMIGPPPAPPEVARWLRRRRHFSERTAAAAGSVGAAPSLAAAPAVITGSRSPHVAGREHK